MENRIELVRRFATIDGSGLGDAHATRYCSIPLAKIAADPAGLPKILAALNWMYEEIGAS